MTDPFWKRAFDFAVALPGLVVAAPVIGVCALAVKLSSPGPAFFSQLRVGRDEQPFHCLKLRTMRHGAASVPTHEAPAGDVTSVGRFLRRVKLDELPQLVNVLAGEMSLVGPRPCLPTQQELIAERRARGVFALRPGITGLAQVRGIDMSNPAACASSDADYLRAVSFRGDMDIIRRTFRR